MNFFCRILKIPTEPKGPGLSVRRSRVGLQDFENLFYDNTE